jgi:TBC1 domain family protein 5
LDRLYLNGVDDDYFRQPERRLALYNVLMVWSARHEVTSYRQGMHEIAGTVLLVLEQEVDAWKGPISPDPGDKASELASSIKPHVTAASLEAHTFWIFERVMKDLEPLFDPTPDEETGMSKVVLYCSNIQGWIDYLYALVFIHAIIINKYLSGFVYYIDHLLREIDSVLFHYLDRQAIQAQLYGMRWSRLMLGREFEVTDSQVLKIWDYIFACCLKTPRAKAFDPLTMPAEDEEDIDINKLWIATNCKGPINPLLMALGNFMIGMLLHVS